MSSQKPGKKFTVVSRNKRISGEDSIPLSVHMKGGVFTKVSPEQFRQVHKPEDAKKSTYHELIKPRDHEYIVEDFRKYSSRLKSQEENIVTDGHYDQIINENGVNEHAKTSTQKI